jgi:hypothetical protein
MEYRIYSMYKITGTEIKLKAGLDLKLYLGLFEPDNKNKL